MKTFKNFDNFFESLINSVDSGKDTYVFGYSLDDKTDYQLLNEDNIDNYYIHWCIDLKELQEKLFLIFINGDSNENIHVAFDYVHDGEVDYERLFIFETEHNSESIPCNVN